MKEEFKHAVDNRTENGADQGHRESEARRQNQNSFSTEQEPEAMTTTLPAQVAADDLAIWEATKTRFWNSAQAARRRGESDQAKELFRISALFGRAEAVYRASLTGRGVTMIFGTQDYRTTTANESAAPAPPPEIVPAKSKRRQKAEQRAARKSASNN